MNTYVSAMPATINRRAPEEMKKEIGMTEPEASERNRAKGITALRVPENFPIVPLYQEIREISIRVH